MVNKVCYITMYQQLNVMFTKNMLQYGPCAHVPFRLQHLDYCNRIRKALRNPYMSAYTSVDLEGLRESQAWLDLFCGTTGKYEESVIHIYIDPKY